jgi:hypothetical protein
MNVPLPTVSLPHRDGLRAAARRAGMSRPQFQRACHDFLREAAAAGLHVPALPPAKHSAPSTNHAAIRAAI